jgi:hypothetical protein
MEQLSTQESSDFLRAKELAQEQEDWLNTKAQEGWDFHELQGQVKVFLYALTDYNFYNLSLGEDEIDFIADGLFDFISSVE